MFTPRVIVTQVLLIVIIWFASKFGKKPLVLTTVVLLLFTLVHLPYPVLLVLQTTVVLATAAIRYHKIREQEVREMVGTFRNILDRLTGK